MTRKRETLHIRDACPDYSSGVRKLTAIQPCLNKQNPVVELKIDRKKRAARTTATAQKKGGPHTRPPAVASPLPKTGSAASGLVAQQDAPHDVVLHHELVLERTQHMHRHQHDQHSHQHFVDFMRGNAFELRRQQRRIARQ